MRQVLKEVGYAFVASRPFENALSLGLCARIDIYAPVFFRRPRIGAG